MDGTGKGKDFEYNLMCNALKDKAQDYFFFLDDDDTLIPGALERIAPFLSEDKPVICQMLRGGRLKPSVNVIERGHIGLPCMILHAKHKHLADVTARESGDYDWIKAVTDRLGYTWVPVALVNSPRRSYGK
jgi:glycosyltransferase involved in cell wall biosynthesis